MKRTLCLTAGVGLLVLSAILLMAGLIQFILPPVFGSKVRMLVPTGPAEGTISDSTSVPQTGFGGPWTQTEFEKLQSKMVLYPVITNLDLNRKWGEKFKEGELRTDVTYLLLKKQIDVRQDANSRLVEVRVTGDDAVEAAAVANEIAAVYRGQEQARQRATHERGIRALESALGAERNDSAREVLERRIRVEKEWDVSKSGGVEIIDKAEANFRPIRPKSAMKFVLFGSGVFVSGVGILLLISAMGQKPSASRPPPLQ